MKNTDLKKEDAEASSIAQKLRLLMKVKNVSELKIARLLDIPVMTIRRVFSGETEDPRISTLKQIADYFKVSIDSLLDKEQTSLANILEKKVATFVPVLDWDIFKKTDSIQNFDTSVCDRWYPIVIDDRLGVDRHTFALESRLSMHVRFPAGTLFIISPSVTPVDGDLVLIKMKPDNELSLRELAIDTPKWQFQPIIPGSDLLFYDKNVYDIVGVVIVTTLQNRK